MTCITHISRMDTVGGIERLLQAFVNTPDDEMIHTLFLTGKPIYPSLRPDNPDIPVFYSRRAGGIPLPKFLRAAHRNKTLARLDPDVISFWGYPTTDHDQMRLPPTARLVYQEHGSCWDMEVTPQKKAFLQRMNGITCCSLAARRMLELRWDCRAPMTVVRNPVAPHALPLNSQPKTAPQNRPLILGTAGRLVPYKATALALFTLKNLLESGANCRLRIAGTGPLFQPLQTAVRKLGILDSVEFCGSLSDMPSFYRSIDLFLLPSIREPLGLVGAEAMAHGCPVVAAAVDGIPEAVSDGINGYCIPPELAIPDFLHLTGKEFGGKLPETVFDPATDHLCSPRAADPQKLAACVLKLQSNAVLYETMSRAAIHQAQEFSFQTYFSTLKSALLEFS